jgi:hypothetical protein
LTPTHWAGTSQPRGMTWRHIIKNCTRNNFQSSHARTMKLTSE